MRTEKLSFRGGNFLKNVKGSSLPGKTLLSSPPFSSFHLLINFPLRKDDQIKFILLLSSTQNKSFSYASNFSLA